MPHGEPANQNLNEIGLQQVDDRFDPLKPDPDDGDKSDTVQPVDFIVVFFDRFVGAHVFDEFLNERRDNERAERRLQKIVGRPGELP